MVRCATAGDKERGMETEKQEGDERGNGSGACGGGWEDIRRSVDGA